MCAECTGHLSKGGDSACSMRGREPETKKQQSNTKTQTKHQNKKNKQKTAEFRSVRMCETW